MSPTETPSRLPLPHSYPRLGPYAQLATDALHQAMQAFDIEFLSGNREALRDYAAHWVADPLHHWSRRWEYPYVFQQLAGWMEKKQAAGLPAGDAPAAGAAASATPGASSGGAGRILDAGSGLTFFPHFIAQQSAVASVECCDRDPAMARDAAQLRPPASARVRYSTQDLAALTYADEAFDCTYCISVLEHTTERDRIVDEFARTLRPGGLLVVTIDVSLDGRAEIPREEAAALMRALERRFEALDAFGPAVVQPPPDVLTTRNVGQVAPELVPPRTYATAGGVLRRLLKPHTFPWGKALRRLLGGTAAPAPSELTFFCTAWVKPLGPMPPVGA